MTKVPNITSATSPERVMTPPETDIELQAQESAGEGIQRIMLEQIDLASWHVQRIAGGPQHLHEVRKASKRIRAVLRIVRDEIGRERYGAMNSAVRDVARELSELRTAIVRVETLEDLVEGVTSLEPSVTAVAGRLSADVDRLQRDVVGDEALVDGVSERLSDVRFTVEAWSLTRDLDPTSLGLRRTYQRGRAGMARAYGDERAESFHRWRKEVKYLRHQMEVLGGMLRETSPTIPSDLEELGDGLGADHDLVDLAGAVSGAQDAFSSAMGYSRLIDAIDRRRGELEAELHPVGARLYGRTTSEFITEMEIAWRQWCGAVV